VCLGVSTYLRVLLLDCFVLKVQEVGAAPSQTVHIAQLNQRRGRVAIAQELQGGVSGTKRITYGFLPVGVLILKSN